MNTRPPVSLRDALARRYVLPTPEETAAANAMAMEAGRLASEIGIPHDLVLAAFRAGADPADRSAVAAAAKTEFERRCQESRDLNREKLVEATARQIPARYANATADHPDVIAWVDDLVRIARAKARVPGSDHILGGPSLLLAGPVGTGKTWQAYGGLRAIAQASVNAGWIFTTAADMYGALRPRHGVDSESELKRFMTARLLVIDDLGAAKDSEFTEEINYRLVNHRYDHELPSLFTTNLPPRSKDRDVPSLADRLGQRVTSRLGEMARHVPLTGTDRRRKVRVA